MKLPGICAYTREQRIKIVNEVVEKLKNRFKNNLQAVSLWGSVARKEDLPCSDIEFVVFLKKKPKNLEKMRAIDKGIRVEIEYYTYKQFIKDYKVITKDWPYYGADKLVPLTNPLLIKKVNNYKIKNQTKKCLKTAKLFFEKEVHEIYCKLFNTILSKNKEFLPFILADTINYTFSTLSLINEKATQSYSKHIKIIKTFKIKPNAYDKLIDIMIKGEFKDLDKIMITAQAVYQGIIDIFKKKKIKLFTKKINL